MMAKTSNTKKLPTFDLNAIKTNDECKYPLSKLVLILSEELREKGQIRTARGYRSVLTSVLDYTSGIDIGMETLSEPFLLDYEAHMHKKENSLSTISFYMRNLRAIYNKGVKMGLYSPSPTPLFDKVYTKIEYTINYSANAKEIVRLEKKLKRLYKEQEKERRAAIISRYKKQKNK